RFSCCAPGMGDLRSLATRLYRTIINLPACGVNRLRLYRASTICEVYFTAVSAVLETKGAIAKEKRRTPKGATAKTHEFLCLAIYSANLAIGRSYAPLLDKLGLTYPQYLVLAALYDQDDQTVGSLGEKLFLDSSTLTPLLKRMESAGFLTRKRDPRDERQ